jgi:hypothetical protein
MVELAACVGAAGLLTSFGAVGLGTQPGGTKEQEAQKKDSMQVRGIGQALVVFAQNNKDQYPLPSKLDAQNNTVKTGGRAKDTTANIYSMLVFNGSISPEMLVSPVEKNPAVTATENYEYDKPKGAAVPEKAIWDPAGIATGLGPEKGNVSYAHLQPAGGRLKAWSNTFMSNESILGTRGPQVTGVAPAKGAGDGAAPVVTLAKKNSTALTLFGDGAWWSGNIAFNDNHVEYLSNMLAHGKPFGGKQTYRLPDGTERPDVIFYDEPEDKEHVNSYLGIWKTAGQDVLHYRGIWD